MNPKILLLIGAISTVAYAITFVPLFQGTYIQGTLWAIYSLSIFTIILIYGNRASTDDVPDACESLCRVLFETLAYTFLFNAFCMLISHDTLWKVSVFQGIFFPAILAGFIGYNTHKKIFRHCSTAVLVVSVVSCCMDCNMATMIQLAILSNIICMIFPIWMSKLSSESRGDSETL